MPSKLDPVSSAAAMVKKRISPSIYARTMQSPVKAISDAVPPKGTRASDISAAAIETGGEALKIQVVVPLYTAPFRRNLIKS